jgi:ATP-dependent DNA ligase
MLAKLAREVPEGDGWIFEPKWDGFRCIVFRDGDELVMSSRRSRPFDRYFPELRGPLLEALPDRAVVDGEIVVPDADDGGLDFDALSQRIHPAASRVEMLARTTPRRSWRSTCWPRRPVAARPRRSPSGRQLLVDHLRPALGAPHAGEHRPDVARRWFTTFEGAGLDGVIAKPARRRRYTPDKRTLVKVKHERTADCVVAGYRIHKDGAGVGSLLLGLYDDDGRLHHVGRHGAFTAAGGPTCSTSSSRSPTARSTITRGATGPTRRRTSGAAPRRGQPLERRQGPVVGAAAIERVAEVTFGQLESGRFRHGSRFVRWRPDREPSSCRYDQLEVAPRSCSPSSSPTRRRLTSTLSERSTIAGAAPCRPGGSVTRVRSISIVTIGGRRCRRRAVTVAVTVVALDRRARSVVPVAGRPRPLAAHRERGAWRR